MKQLYQIVAILVMLSLSISASAQNQLFGTYQSRSDVRYVCITQTMLHALEQGQQLSIGTYDLSPIVEQIETIVIIRSDKQTGRDRMAFDRERLLKDRNYQTLLLRNIEGVQSLRLYRPQGRYPAEFILYQNNGNEAIYIVLTGTFTADQMNQIFK